MLVHYKELQLSSGAIERCLGALDILAAEPDGLALVDIALRLDMPKSNAHRMLALMAQSGYVRQTREGERYFLTMRLPTLAFRFLSGTRIIDLCQPVLDKLASETSELVRMTFVEGERISWIAKAQGAKHGLRFEPGMGLEVRVQTTASGRAWLMTQSDEFAAKILLAQGLAPPGKLGANAPKSLEQFLLALKSSRELGYSVAIDEGEIGMSAIALPIIVDEVITVGTVSIAGPSARLDRETLVGFLSKLKQANSQLAELWSLGRLGVSE